MIGYFADKETDSYKTFRRVAMQLRDDCVYHAAVGYVETQFSCEGPSSNYSPYSFWEKQKVMTHHKSFEYRDNI